MIKVEKNHECESYWYRDSLYDSLRKKKCKISIFGITIWKNSDDYKCDLKKISENKCGFNNDK